MEKIISIVLCCFAFLGSSIREPQTNSNFMAEPYYNNVTSIDCIFVIVDGEATVKVTYYGKKATFEQANIKIKIERKTFGIFWKDIEKWEDTSFNLSENIIHKINVKTGQYRATFKVEIIATGGSPEVIERKIEREY